MLDAPLQSRLTGSRAVFVYALIALACGSLLLMIGEGGALIDRVIAVVFTVLNSVWIPLIYLIGSLGLGRIVRTWTSQLPTRWIIELAVGFTIMLTLSHGLGVLGVLNPLSAWGVIFIGCAFVAIDGRSYLDGLNTAIGQTTLSLPGVAFVLGCVVVVLMSCNPPGVSWDSEFGGYDALSYHLQLPREWLEAGRIWPSEHNVYSFLPGYFESAYLHFAHLAGSPRITDSGISGFFVSDARAAMSTQLFSALLVIVSGIAMGQVADRCIELYLPDTNQKQPYASRFARMLMACTPWLIVVGSLAYNEMGMVFLGVGALAIAIEHRARPMSRSCIAALIVGGACSVKLTALFFIAPSIAVILLSTIPRRNWFKPIFFGVCVGTLTLLPWMIRNEIATGNVVFPQVHSIFGHGHWTNNQHALYQVAHQFDGSLIDRLSLLVLSDSDGTDHVSRYRGLTNIQWGITPLLGLIGCILLIARPTTRKLGAVVSLALILPIISWMLLTHLQSRFLVPMAPIFIGAGALGLASVPIEQLHKRITQICSLVALGIVVAVTAVQSGGNPFQLVDLGTGVFTGEIEINDAPWTATLNTILDSEETVYLLGDATPMYLRSPMVYNTVYDHWLIEDAIIAHPDAPLQWTGFLRSQGIDIVVVSFSEINRYAQSRWLPESIKLDQLIDWIDSLPEPIYVWTAPNNSEPIRAAFRLSK